LIASLVAACGGSSNKSCPALAGAYPVTTEIVSVSGCTLVRAGTITRNVTYTFTQATPSCDFKMVNSVYPDSTYSGHFTMSGSAANVHWDSEEPALSFTYSGEDLTLTPASASAGATLIGNFAWTTGSCQGTTNVCAGDVTDCTSPH